jgi:hypothetical protein
LGCALVHPDLWTQPPNTEVQGGCSCVQCCLFFVSRPQLPPSSPQARPTVGLAPTPQKLCCSPTRNQDYPGASWPCRESADGDCFWIRFVCCVLCVRDLLAEATNTHTHHPQHRPTQGRDQILPATIRGGFYAQWVLVGRPHFGFVFLVVVKKERVPQSVPRYYTMLGFVSVRFSLEGRP